MDSADSAISGALQRLTSPPVLLAVLALLVALVIALLVARALRTRAAREAAGSPPAPAHGLNHALRGAVMLAPLLAALAVMLGAHVALAALGVSTTLIDGAQLDRQRVGSDAQGAGGKGCAFRRSTARTGGL